jgi:ubiquinone/menaquinone biosynthesis C-methylase UbiE
VEREIEYPTRREFDQVYEALPRSPTVERVSAEVYADDYSPELESYSFVTLTDLRQMAAALQIGPGSRFLDVGCGRGGPGLWLSRHTGAALTGIDYSWVGIAHAERRAVRFEVSERARFVACDAAAVAIGDRTHDAAISVDALQLMSARPQVLRELARVLRPGAPLVFTTWEWRAGVAPEGPTRILADHEPLLAEAGFALEMVGETADWERRQRAYYQGLLDWQESLVAEMGDEVAGDLLKEATEVPRVMDSMRRVMVVARLTSAGRARE